MNHLFRWTAWCVTALVMTACLSQSKDKADSDEGLPESFQVLTFNLWHGGDAGKRPLSDTLRVLQRVDPDAVCFQEVQGLAADQPDNAARMARELGWNYVALSGRRGIATRHTVIERAKDSIVIGLSSGRTVRVACVHLPSAPYQPYQLARISYQGGRFLTTAEEAVEAARAARGEQVSSLLIGLESALDNEEPLIVGGDFNEPSHMDWTPAAVARGWYPIAVAWPTSSTLAEAGLVDTWRALHPNPLEWPGLTWTPTTKPDDPNDRHDRIDWLLHAGSGVRPVRIRVVGESSLTSEVVCDPWPSDHRAVAATYLLTGAAAR